MWFCLYIQINFVGKESLENTLEQVYILHWKDYMTISKYIQTFKYVYKA